MVSRRAFLKLGAAMGGGAVLASKLQFIQQAFAQYVAQNSLDPTQITKYAAPLVIPPAMPRTSKINQMGGKNIDYFEIGVKPGGQQILPMVDGFGPTPVWSYYSVNHPLSWNYPAFTIEAKWTKPVRVKWINQLDGQQHLLPVDPTLHWANPIGMRDMRPLPTDTDYWTHHYIDANENGAYVGPVPIVTHVHGAHTHQESDGYPEAWYLPASSYLDPYIMSSTGTFYDIFEPNGVAPWGQGFAVFEYPNDQRATTLWYHDHSLGMTRLNVYAGPAGFYIIRGGPDDMVLDLKGKPAVLPGPAPALGDPPGLKYYEIPIVIQDRTFDTNGNLWYPLYRAFFEGLDPADLQIPFTPATTLAGAYSDVAPIWQPEFFGNVMVVNGVSWPFQTVEQRRYRFRFLNGCQSRFLILDFNQIPGVQVWQIGNEGGFLAQPVDITALGNTLLMGLAERADVIVDFTNVPLGSWVLGNLGPDEPFGGGVPGVDFDPADPASTGQVMAFNVVPALTPDPTTPPQFLVLPPITPLPFTPITRQLALIEKMGMGYDASGEPLEGPVEALLGTVGPDSIDPTVPAGVWTERKWMEPVTENPALGATEIWEMYNTTGDAHPMHIHEVVFEVVNREGLVTDEAGDVVEPIQLDGVFTLPEPWETGFKDTVIAYPGQVTRVKAQFNTPGQFVWHCHIVEHEDNEMMRPYRIGPEQPGQPGSMPMP